MQTWDLQNLTLNIFHKIGILLHLSRSRLHTPDLPFIVNKVFIFLSHYIYLKRKFLFSYSTRSDFRHINTEKRSLIHLTFNRQKQLIRPHCSLSMESALHWRQKSVNWWKAFAIPILQSAFQKLLWVLLLTSEIHINFIFETSTKKEEKTWSVWQVI